MTLTHSTRSERSRNWCFTINNPDLADDPQLWDNTRYICWQKEQGESLTPHLQGYVVWTRPYALSWCRRMNSRAHWEIARGTLDQNIKYCTKEPRLDGPWTRGLKPQQGKRSDILDVTEALDDGSTMREVALSFPAAYVKYHSGFYKYRLETAPDRYAEPNILILHGPSGCGKSKLVHATFPGAYRKPKGKWWDGYHTQEAVIFDDFYSWISYDEILRILDWYPLMVEFKNGYVRLLASTFVFTSNQNPSEWYRGGRDGGPDRDRSALWRRFKQFAVVIKYCSYRKDWYPDTQFKDMPL